MPDDGAPLRVVQVGAGGMGRHWLELLVRTAEVEVVGIVDLDVERATDVGAELGLSAVSVGRSLTDIAGRSAAQAVVNVTVPAAHVPVTLEALALGLPVLCEKPLAPTVAEALVLAAASEASDRLLMTSQSRRYSRPLEQVRAALTEIGDIGVVACDFFRAPRFGGFREEMAHPLLLDMAIHPFDLARLLLGSEPVSVTCESFNPSWSWFDGDAAAVATFEFADGARFSWTGSWCSPGFETSWEGSWRFSGRRGTLLWDGETHPSVDAGTASADVIPGSPDQESPTGAVEGIEAALHEFLDAVRTGSTPSGEVHSNVRSLAMVEAAVESATLRRRIDLDLLLERAHAAALAASPTTEITRVLSSWGTAAEGLAKFAPSR